MAYSERTKIKGKQSDFYPQAVAVDKTVIKELSIDVDGNVIGRSAVLTDEGTVRLNFANLSLAVSIGSCTFTNGSNIVTGTALDTVGYDINVGDYVKLNSDPQSAYAQIEAVSLTEIVLVTNYTGATGTGASSRQRYNSVTGTGQTITVASGQATIAGGTTIGAFASIFRKVDVAPLIFRTSLSVSQRIVNQTIHAGLSDIAATQKWFARFQFDGTVNNQVKCRTARNPTSAPSASETQETIITLPNGLNTSTLNEYRVELLTERVLFFVNRIQVAEHTRVIPSQYDIMQNSIDVVNGGVAPASNTNVISDYLTCKNHNKLEVGIFSDGERIQTILPPKERFTYNVAGVIAINTDLIVIDCANFKSLLIQCTAMGTTGVVTPQWSATPDFAVPITATLFDQGASSTTFNAAVGRNTNVFLRYFRLRLTTATTAGTTTIQVDGSHAPLQTYLATQPISGTVTANIGTGSLAAGTNAIGDVGLQVRANATGAASKFHLISAATTNATNVKNAAGRLLGWRVANTNAAYRYVKLHNIATAPTAGAGVVETIAVPPNSVNAGSILQGSAFTTGIGLTTVTGSADADATAVALGDLIIDLYFA